MKFSSILAVLACFIAGYHLTLSLRPPQREDEAYTAQAYAAAGGLALAAVMLAALLLDTKRSLPPARTPIDSAGLAIPEPVTLVAPIAVSPPPPPPPPISPPAPPAAVVSADPLTTTLPLYRD